jgi:hypothetical protein
MRDYYISNQGSYSLKSLFTTLIVLRKLGRGPISPVSDRYRFQPISHLLDKGKVADKKQTFLTPRGTNNDCKIFDQ